jgi:hypothetical protein
LGVERGRFCPGADVELVVDVFQVLAHGPGADEQRLCDHGVRLARHGLARTTRSRGESRSSFDRAAAVDSTKPIYPDTVTTLMTKLIRAHNDPENGSRPKDQLPHAWLHDLRHIHATTLLLSGVPVHVVAARLGHADPAITLRVYTHVIRSAEASAADIFAQAVSTP